VSFNAVTGQDEPDAPAAPATPPQPQPAAAPAAPAQPHLATKGWVKRTDGSLAHIDNAADMAAESNKGSVLASDDDLKAYDHQRNMDSPAAHIAAGLMGLADTLPLPVHGLLRGAAPQIAKDAEESAAAHPVLSGVGTVAGVLADPFGMASEIGKVGTAAGRTVTGVLAQGAAEQAAKAAAEHGAEAVIPSLASRVLNNSIAYAKSAAPRVVDNATQGALWSAQQLINEGDLGKTPEEIAGHVAVVLGGGAVLGGVGSELAHTLFAHVLPAPVVALKKLMGESGSAVTGLKNAYKTVAEKLGVGTAEGLNAIDAQAEHIATEAEAMKNAPQVMTNAEAGTKKAYRINLNDKKSLDQAAEHVSGALTDMHAGSEAVTEHLENELLPKATERNLKGQGSNAAVQDMAEVIVEQGRRMIGSKATDDLPVSGLMAANDTSIASEVTKAYERYAAKVGPADTLLDQNKALEQLNRELKATYYKRVKNPNLHPGDAPLLSGQTLTPGGPKAGGLKQLIDAHDTVLASPALWGEDQARLIQQKNAVYGDLIGPRDQFRKDLTDNLGKFSSVKSQKMSTLIKQGGTYAKSDVLDNLSKYQESVEKQHAFAESVAKSVYDPADAVAGAGAKAREQMEEAKNAINMAGQTRGRYDAVQQQIKSAAGKDGIGSKWNLFTLSALIAGHHLAVPVAAVRMGAAALDAPYMLGMLTKLGRSMGKADTVLGGVAAAIIKGEHTLGSKLPGFINPLAARWTAKQYREQAAKAGNLQGDPESVLNHLESQAGDLQTIAPQAYAALAQQRGVQIQMLAENLKGPQIAGVIPKDYTPSATEIAKMQKTDAVIKDPQLAVRMALAGVLTPAIVQTWGKAHPQHLQTFQEKLTHELSGMEKGQKLSLKAANTLAVLGLGAPNATYSQPMLFRTQSIYAARAAGLGGPGQKTGPGSRGGQPGKITAASDILMPGQRAAARSQQVR
jgi:hypothetical protein